MPTVSDVQKSLEDFAPPDLAEDWDNVGLLLGRPETPVSRIMTCLTLTPDVACEAVESDVDLIVTHHPILFRPIQRLTSESTDGDMMLRLIESGVSVYSPHTAFDSASEGINQQLAELLGLGSITPLRDFDSDDSGTESRGSGRCGQPAAEQPLGDFVETVKSALGIEHVMFVGAPEQPVRRVGIACGSAAEFMGDAVRQGCDVLVTGEAKFHACLEARSHGIALILTGHYASERHGVEKLAGILAAQYPDVDVTASCVETDPIRIS